ncbi:hypothetical protein E9229_000835 [Paeniglutamicibacter cryotolerans]|uniref:Uncharacterized protein n=1 Tax=Paeniglutamicibacter cryotolerans TaxID=670079 RepID=A0A839QIS6_9MICC|nr:hypothetical protein [Paeniglutamicibacter cryotolerans]
MNKLRKYHKPIAWLLIIGLVGSIGTGLISGML